MTAAVPPRLSSSTPIDTAALGGLRSALYGVDLSTLAPPSAQTVLHLYRTRWNHVDQTEISAEDAALLRRLVDELGNGVFLA